MILAIDPGISGALALYNPDLEFLHTEALPIQWRIVNGKKKSEIDLPALRAYITTRRELIHKIVLEKPTAMPGAGDTSQFNFGMTCGQLEGLVIGIGIDIQRVHPTTWKTAMDVPSDKRRSKGRAVIFLPQHAARLRAGTEGEAEAAMLAFYGHGFTHKAVKTTPGKAPRNTKKKK